MIAFVLSNRNVFNSFHASEWWGRKLTALRMTAAPFSHRSIREQRSSPEPSPPNNFAGLECRLGGNCCRHKLAESLDLLTRRGFSLVVLGNNVVGEWRNDEYNAVYFDDIEGAYDATRYLQSLGHRQIWYVGNRRLPWFESRYQGYRRAMEESALPLLLNDFDSTDPGRCRIPGDQSILKSGESMTAILAGEDLAARGAYKAIQESGLKIPDDISVVGFNDNEAAGSESSPHDCSSFH